MLRASIVSAIALVALLATACGSSPFLLLPGGALEGASSPVPGDWSNLREVDTVQLETNPAEPYSVNIWAIGLDQYVYVHAGASRATWIEHMEQNPLVRLQIDDTIYDLSAERVTEQAEFDRFADVYEKKYGNRPRNESVVEAYLFRLAAR